MTNISRFVVSTGIFGAGLQVGETAEQGITPGGRHPTYDRGQVLAAPVQNLVEEPPPMQSREQRGPAPAAATGVRPGEPASLRSAVPMSEGPR
ncbi:hypothetical protein [Actinomadura opuntiae]|uniref:hypothetical protein n=1 Tax=Actinomadura sp. OS1-43 TaxID=604315 RepID=UPI00255AEEBE|nr:hypothetical protein [Actinomadura sp. OS1-43]MDL4814437.1 hypothetical protein [Actinomadura sp. OS1-43]